MYSHVLMPLFFDYHHLSRMKTLLIMTCHAFKLCLSWPVMHENFAYHDLSHMKTLLIMTCHTWKLCFSWPFTHENFAYRDLSCIKTLHIMTCHALKLCLSWCVTHGNFAYPDVSRIETLLILTCHVWQLCLSWRVTYDNFVCRDMLCMTTCKVELAGIVNGYQQDVYDVLLTQAEIQGNIQQRNGEYSVMGMRCSPSTPSHGSYARHLCLVSVHIRWLELCVCVCGCHLLGHCSLCVAETFAADHIGKREAGVMDCVYDSTLYTSFERVFCRVLYSVIEWTMWLKICLMHWLEDLFNVSKLGCQM